MSRSILTFLVILAFQSAMAQGSGAIEDKQFIIEKNRTIILPEISRSFGKIPYSPPKREPIRLNYQLEPAAWKTEPVKMGMRMQMLKPEPLEKLYSSYLAIGAGNYASTFAEGFVSNKRNEKWQTTAHFRHLAANRGVFRYASNSEQDLSLSGSYFSKFGTWGASINGSRQKVGLYGYDPQFVPTEDSSSLVYQQMRFSFSHAFAKETSPLFSSIKLSYNQLSMNTGNKENLFHINAQLNYRITSRITTENNLVTNFAQVGDSSMRQRNLLNFSSQILYLFGDWRLKAGVRMVYDSDTVPSNEGINLYPLLSAQYTIHERSAIAYAGISGDISYNSLNSVRQMNPFLVNEPFLANTNETFSFLAGIKGNPVSSLSYQADLKIRRVKYLQSWTSLPISRERYFPLYDGSASNVISLSAEAAIKPAENWTASSSIAFHQYDMGSLPEAWHLPTFEFKAQTAYLYQQKLRILLAAHLLGGLKAPDFRSDSSITSIDLPFIPDISIHVDYSFSRQFGLFLHFNNLMSVNYQPFRYYPVRGFNLLGGLKLSF